MLAELLKELRQKEIEISFSDGKLNYSGPEENITPALLKNLKEYKNDLIKHFWPSECRNLMAINTSGEKTPIIFVDCVNLSVELSKLFGPEQPVYVFFENEWISGRKSKYESIESQAKDFIRQLKVVFPEGNLYLGGDCFGGVLAYEMAVQLAMENREVPLVFMFNSLNRNKVCSNSENWSIKSLIKLNRSDDNGFKDSMNKIVLFLTDNLKDLIRIIVVSFKSVSKSPPSRKTAWHYHMYHRSSLMSCYQPRQYKGNLLLFKSKKGILTACQDFGWADLVSGIRIITRDVPPATFIDNKNNQELFGREIIGAVSGFKNIY